MLGEYRGWNTISSYFGGSGSEAMKWQDPYKICKPNHDSKACLRGFAAIAQIRSFSCWLEPTDFDSPSYEPSKRETLDVALSSPLGQLMGFLCLLQVFFYIYRGKSSSPPFAESVLDFFANHLNKQTPRCLKLISGLWRWRHFCCI